MTRLIISSLVLVGGIAFAHKGSDAYWTLTASGAELGGQLDVALVDLHAANGLDDDRDGQLTWAEVRAHEAALGKWLSGQLALEQAGAECPLELFELAAIRHSDGTYASWKVRARCEAEVRQVTAKYDALFDVDAQHRGLLRVAGGEWVAFSNSNRTRAVEFTAQAPSHQFVTALLEGMHHLAIGWDHLCFLFALLLPSVLRRRERAWLPRETLKEILLEVTKVVTAFTVAHSVTLGLAAFGLLAPNPAFVEVAIALSVVLAAANTLFPVVTEGRWTLAFGLGLLHGFGFVSALTDLGTSGAQLLVSLVGFNLGVEAGQLLVVACFVPVAFLLRQHAWYPRRLVPLGGLALMLLATVWTWERWSSL